MSFQLIRFEKASIRIANFLYICLNSLKGFERVLMKIMAAGFLAQLHPFKLNQ